MSSTFGNVLHLSIFGQSHSPAIGCSLDGIPAGIAVEPAVEIPKDTANGDYTTTFCLAAAKALRKNPREVAQILLDNMDLSGSYFTSAAMAGPGFLNFTLGTRWFGETVCAVQQAGADYGKNDMLSGKKYMVEFVSANPTGPMHMGNARGGVLGDTLASVLQKSGADVWREFYVNDAGNQIEKFAKSLEARYFQIIKGEDAVEFPEDGYHGDDIRELAKLIDDMLDTMYEANGVGLAAPQVGILKRIVVIDVGDDNPLCLINPVIFSPFKITCCSPFS